MRTHQQYPLDICKVSQRWYRPEADTIIEDMAMNTCRRVYDEFDIVDLRGTVALIIKAVRHTVRYTA